MALDRFQKKLIVFLILPAIAFAFVDSLLPFGNTVAMIIAGVYVLLVTIIVKKRTDGISFIGTLVLVVMCTVGGFVLYAILVRPLVEDLPFVQAIKGLFTRGGADG